MSSKNFQGSVDVTEEYKRVRDILHRHKKYNIDMVSSRRYKTADDLASEIFMALFERDYWSKWDPKGLPLDKYTFMGVDSLIKNELRRKKVFTYKHCENTVDTADDLMAFEDHGDYLPDDRASYTRVSHYASTEDEVALDLLTVSLHRYLLSQDTGVEGVTYSDVFALLQLPARVEDRPALLGVKSQTRISKLLRETKILCRNFQALAA